MKGIKHKKRIVGIMLSIILALTAIPNVLNVYAETEQHTHTENCYCKGGEYICGLTEKKGHSHAPDCYEDDDEDEEASSSSLSHKKLICGQIVSKGHRHTKNCICPGGELICGQEAEKDKKPISFVEEDEEPATNSNLVPTAVPFDAEPIDNLGSLTISKKVTGSLAPADDTLFEFSITKDGSAAVGTYSVNGSADSSIPSDGKISLQAGQSAVLNGLEPGDYIVTESCPKQAAYESTLFSVDHGTEEYGLSAFVTVTSASTSVSGGWNMENGSLVKDEDGYFTYTLTSDQIDSDGSFEVDCDPIAEYMEADMRDNQNWGSVNFKVKFINETGTSIQYKDYSFDTVNWLPVGDIYTPSSTLSMLNTNEGASSTSAGYGWGEVWQQLYPMLIGRNIASATLDATGFDGNEVRVAMAPLRCINPAIISYFNSNPGKGTLTGNDTTDRASYVTLLQMNEFPELIKQGFTFKNWEGADVSLPADSSRTYSDFICEFYGVSSLNELTPAQKYNVLGTGSRGSAAMPYDGQANIWTYYKNIAGSMENWCIPYDKLDDGSLDYFKAWGMTGNRVEAGKRLISGGQEFDDSTAALYAYQPNYYLMESDSELLSMAYEYLYDRCIRFSLDSEERPISISFDNSDSPEVSVGGIKDYIVKTDEATANVLGVMKDGEKIVDGEVLTLDHIKGYIEVPNAWSRFRYYDFGFNLTFEAEGSEEVPASVTFTNVYGNGSIPDPTPTPTPIPTPNPVLPDPDNNDKPHHSNGGGGHTSKSTSSTQPVIEIVNPEIPTEPETLAAPVATVSEIHPSSDSTPKTGDDMPLALWLSLMGSSLIGLTVSVSNNRKKSCHKK